MTSSAPLPYNIQALPNLYRFSNKVDVSEQAEDVTTLIKKRRLIKIYLLIAFVIIAALIFTVPLAVFLTKRNTTTKPVICNYGYVSDGTKCIECGTSNTSPNLRVVGGIQAVANSWPAHAVVEINYQADNVYVPLNQTFINVTARYICAGTILNRYTILTAAHCILDGSFYYTFQNQSYLINVTWNNLYPNIESMMTVHYGMNNISFIRSKSQTHAYTQDPGYNQKVQKVIKHPSYTDDEYKNDLGLLILVNPIDFNSMNVKPSCLPNQSSVYPLPNTPTWGIGYGALKEGGKGSVVLYNVEVTTYNGTMCDDVLPEIITKYWESQICAGEYAGGKDTCQGDSGGGLYTRESVNGYLKYFVSGITSYGEGCARKGLPGIYTRVSYFAKWIKENWKV